MGGDALRLLVQLLGQVIATLRPIPARDQVCQQRLRLESGGQGKLAGSILRRLPAVEARPAQTADLQLRRHRALKGVAAVVRGGWQRRMTVASA